VTLSRTIRCRGPRRSLLYGRELDGHVRARGAAVRYNTCHRAETQHVARACALLQVCSLRSETTGTLWSDEVLQGKKRKKKPRAERTTSYGPMGGGFCSLSFVARHVSTLTSACGCGTTTSRRACSASHAPRARRTVTVSPTPAGRRSRLVAVPLRLSLARSRGATSHSSRQITLVSDARSLASAGMRLLQVACRAHVARATRERDPHRRQVGLSNQGCGRTSGRRQLFSAGAASTRDRTQLTHE